MNMKALVFVKTNGPLEGGIVAILPNRPDQIGDCDMNVHVAFVIDLNIPCEQNFQDWNFKCSSCKYNDPDLCEFKKFNRGAWGDADLLNKPKVIHKYRYQIDFKKLISEDSLLFVLKDKKTVKEKDNGLLVAGNNPVDKSIIEDKVK